MMKRLNSKRTKKQISTLDTFAKGIKSSGLGTDISRFGIYLEDTPKKVHSGESELTIIASGHGKKFRLHIKSRWSVLDGYHNMSGISVNEPQKKMREYIGKIESSKIEKS